MKRYLGIALSLFPLLTTPISFAQGNWPTKPIRLIIPFGPGSGLDSLGRTFAESLGEQLKTPIVVENKEGAGGSIGAMATARSAADGYTIMLTAHAPFAIAPYVQTSKTYDPKEDFTPIAKVAVTPMLLVTGSSSPFKTFDDVVRNAKANPGKLSYASSGIGTPSHLHMEVIKHELGLNMVDVPYKNTGQALSDVMGDQVPLYMPSFPAALSLVKSGKLRALAIGSSTRSPVLPDVPTLSELLKRPKLEATVWYGFLAPKGLSPDITQRLYKEIAIAVATPKVIDRIEKLGAGGVLVDPKAFDSEIRRDADSAHSLLKASGIKVEK